MKPFPNENSQPAIRRESAVSALPAVSAEPNFTSANGKGEMASHTLYRSYPWMLLASTAVAGVFCLLYITKPVVQASQSIPPQPTTQPSVSLPETPPNPQSTDSVKANNESKVLGSLMPNPDRLPGESSMDSTPSQNDSTPTKQQPIPSPAYEETNLRVQHIINAEGPDGLLAKIHLNVPVIYQSRNLRWMPEEVSEARELLIRLSDYQEKNPEPAGRRHRATRILESSLERSIPSDELRADSPTIPQNQRDA
ncbi:MAG: hypothetical protein HC767_12170, partial [Akkermansiaceae bacterium]|nr:hypothetical protein [Akkermansiaceae bacterium]